MMFLLKNKVVLLQAKVPRSKHDRDKEEFLRPLSGGAPQNGP